MTNRSIQAGQVVVRLRLKDEMTKAMQQALLNAKTFGAKMSAAASSAKVFSQNMRRVADGAREAAHAMTGFSIAAAAPFALGIKAFADFQKEMSKVQALTDASGTQFAKLEKDARRLGATTIFTATQSAKAMSVFALAGFKVNEIMQAVAPTLDLAAAGGVEIAEAGEIVVKVMKGMGIAISQTRQVTDTLSLAMTTANTDIHQLGEAFKFVAPVARAANMSLAETTAIIQSLSDAGIQAELAGTTLRGILATLVGPSKAAQAVLDELGVTITEDGGKMKKFTDIIGELERGLDGLASGDKAEALARLFPNRQLAGAFRLIAEGKDKLGAMTKALENASGTSAMLAAVQLDNIVGDFTLLKSVVTDVGISIGKALNEDVRGFLVTLKEAAAGINRFIQQNSELVRTGAKIAAAFVAVNVSLFATSMVFRAVAASAGILSGALSLVGKASSAIGNLAGASTDSIESAAEDAAATAQAKSAAALEAQSGSASKAAKSMMTLTAATNKVTKSTVVAIKTSDKYTASLAKQDKSVATVVTAQRGLAASFSKSVRAMLGQSKAAKRASTSTAGLATAIKVLHKPISGANRTLNVLVKNAIRYAKNVTLAATGSDALATASTALASGLLATATSLTTVNTAMAETGTSATAASVANDTLAASNTLLAKSANGSGKAMARLSGRVLAEDKAAKKAAKSNTALAVSKTALGSAAMEATVAMQTLNIANAAETAGAARSAAGGKGVVNIAAHRRKAIQQVTKATAQSAAVSKQAAKTTVKAATEVAAAGAIAASSVTSIGTGNGLKTFSRNLSTIQSDLVGLNIARTFAEADQQMARTSRQVSQIKLPQFDNLSADDLAAVSPTITRSANAARKAHGPLTAMNAALAVGATAAAKGQQSYIAQALASDDLAKGAAKVAKGSTAANAGVSALTATVTSGNVAKAAKDYQALALSMEGVGLASLQMQGASVLPTRSLGTGPSLASIKGDPAKELRDYQDEAIKVGKTTGRAAKQQSAMNAAIIGSTAARSLQAEAIAIGKTTHAAKDMNDAFGGVNPPLMTIKQFNQQTEKSTKKLSAMAASMVVANGSMGSQPIEKRRRALLKLAKSQASTTAAARALRRVQDGAKAVGRREIKTNALAAASGAGKAASKGIGAVGNAALLATVPVKKFSGALKTGFTKTIAKIGVGLLSLGGIFTFVGTAVATIGGAIASVATSPITLAIAAIAAASAVLVKFTGVVGYVKDAFKNFSGIGTTVLDTFSGIKAAFNSGELKLAAEIAFTGMKVVAIKSIRGILPFVWDMLKAIAKTLRDFVFAIPDMLKSALQGGQSFARAIGSFFSEAADGFSGSLETSEAHLARLIARARNLNQEFKAANAAGSGEEVSALDGGISVDRANIARGFQAKIRELQEQFNSGAITKSGFDTRFAELTNGFNDVNKILDRQQKFYDNQLTTAEGISKAHRETVSAIKAQFRSGQINLAQQRQSFAEAKKQAEQRYDDLKNPALAQDGTALQATVDEYRNLLDAESAPLRQFDTTVDNLRRIAASGLMTPEEIKALHERNQQTFDDSGFDKVAAAQREAAEKRAALAEKHRSPLDVAKDELKELVSTIGQNNIQTQFDKGNLNGVIQMIRNGGGAFAAELKEIIDRMRDADPITKGAKLIRDQLKTETDKTIEELRAARDLIGKPGGITQDEFDRLKQAKVVQEIGEAPVFQAESRSLSVMGGNIARAMQFGNFFPDIESNEEQILKHAKKRNDLLGELVNVLKVN